MSSVFSNQKDMSLLLIAKNRDLQPWKDALLEIDPNLDVEIWPRVEHKERVTFAVCWNHPENVLGNYPNLTAVSSLGAGVNHLLNDASIPEKVAICRVVVPSLKEQMAEYVLNAIQNYRFNMSRYIEQKREGYWSKHDAVPRSKATVGVLGLGEMGVAIAEHLHKNGFEVHGWSRSKKEHNFIQSYAENDLNLFLSTSNILVCALPLTKQTKGFLDLELFKKLKSPAYLINVGRGQHLVEEDLIYALDTRVLTGATLDVFDVEPLPSNHLFWNRPNITITPHIASVTDPVEASELLVENYKRSMSGMELRFQIDRAKGY